MNKGFFTSTNHIRVGISYFVVSFVAAHIGVALSMLIRLELSRGGNLLGGSKASSLYQRAVTMHGLIMIFFVVMPVFVGGFAN